MLSIIFSLSFTIKNYTKIFIIKVSRRNKKQNTKIKNKSKTNDKQAPTYIIILSLSKP